MAVYVALEGPDGVGKSSTAVELKKLLQRRFATPAYPGTPFVTVRHFPTDVLALCAEREDRALTAEDYLGDMETWLSFGSAPVLYPDTPAYTPTAFEDATTVYILDRWVLSTSIYAHLRNEKIRPSLHTTIEWLSQVPLITFVLMPKRDQTSDLVDPDYPGPHPYDPLRTTGAYRRFLQGVFLRGALDVYFPIVIDRTVDTPRSVAYTIAEWLGVTPAAATD